MIRPVRISVVMLFALSGACVSAADDADKALLSEASNVHASVRLVDARDGTAIAFPQGGLALPTENRLTADAGSIDLWCRPAEDWPDKEDRALLHVGDTSHSHVTLFARDGRLYAVYKGDVDHYASLRYDASAWPVDQWRHVQYSWQPGDSPDGVLFFLRVDGRLIGLTTGKRIAEWPETLYIGVRGNRSPWRGEADDVTIRPRPIAIPELAPGRATITVDASRPLGPCWNFWSTSNFTSQHMFVDPRAVASLKRTHPLMHDVNCVRLLGGRSDERNRFYLGVDDDGNVRADFTDLKRYLRGIVDAGYTPRIVLDNVPTAMSDVQEMNTYGNTTPPKDAELWRQYVVLAIRAMIDEFGMETVAAWRFRVGTEPDLHPGHWSGTKQQYLDHFKATTLAVTSILPDADIGPGNILNPAGDHKTPEGPAWGLDIIEFAAAERLPMKHFSCSWYGGVGRPTDTFTTAIEAMRERLDRYEAYRHTPIEVAEYGILHDENRQRLWSGDITEWGASFQAAVADDVYRLNVRRVHEWAQTTAGVIHPRAAVLTMLEQMADGERLTTEVESTPGARCGAVAVEKDGALWLLVYHHRALRTPRVDQQVTLTVRDDRMRRGRPWKMDQRLIDRDHGVWGHAFYADCEAEGIAPLPDSPYYGGNIALRFGRPGQVLFHQNRDKYEKLSDPPQVADNESLDVDDGRATIDLTLQGHAVTLIRLTPPEN